MATAVGFHALRADEAVLNGGTLARAVAPDTGRSSWWRPSADILDVYGSSAWAAPTAATAP